MYIKTHDSYLFYWNENYLGTNVKNYWGDSRILDGFGLEKYSFDSRIPIYCTGTSLLFTVSPQFSLHKHPYIHTYICTRINVPKLTLSFTTFYFIYLWSSVRKRYFTGFRLPPEFVQGLIFWDTVQGIVFTHLRLRVPIPPWTKTSTPLSETLSKCLVNWGFPTQSVYLFPSSLWGSFPRPRDTA